MDLMPACICSMLDCYGKLPLNWFRLPQDGKLCFSDDTFPDGLSVRKGDQVAYQPYVMGRLKWLWGDDAEEFRPERWLNEDGVFQQESSFKFTAFQVRNNINRRTIFMFFRSL